MARSLNQVTLMGNLTRDPELRQTPNGNNVVSFSLALNSSYKQKDSDEWQEKTDYIDIVAWSTLAQRIDQYLKKGSRCLVQGKLQSRQWEQDGIKRNKVEVQASDVTFLDSRGSSEQAKPDAPKQAVLNTSNGEDAPINLNDIPF